MNDLLRVLIIDDNPDDRILVVRGLRREFTHVEVKQTIIEAEGLTRALEAGDFDLVITDYQLRWSDGLAVLRRVKDRYPDCPVVMFTATGSEEIAVEAMKKGLDDYVIKAPQHFIRLSAAVRGVLKATADRIARQLVEEQLRTSLREKEVLLQEVHHRVKNNLQIIASLLDLQADSLGDAADPHLLQIFQDTRHRVHAMVLVHETLFQSPDLARIGARPYLTDLVSHLLGAYSGWSGEVMVAVEVDDVMLDTDTAIPCGLIVNELVSNALKYAFPLSPPVPSPSEGPGGTQNELKVELRETGDGELCLSASDNGVGLPPNVDLAAPKSLGLRLVSLLARQLRGTLEVDRSGGTTFRLTWKRSEGS